jgi:hypothetical protein
MTMRMTRLPRGAQELLEYFQGVNREYPEKHWENGIRMCEEWLSMSRRSDVTQTEIDNFLIRLTSEKNPGSGWIDLGMQFGAWARDHGFRTDKQ